MNQSYKLVDFVKGCAGEIAYVSAGAMETAKRDFNLNTQIGVLQFIGNGGLEKPSFINSKPWENNRSTVSIMVDAWGFYSGELFGYIAFFFNPVPNKWTIKSFKKNINPDIRNLAFKELKDHLRTN